MPELCEKYIEARKLIKELIPDWDRIPAEIRQVRMYNIMHHKCQDRDIVKDVIMTRWQVSKEDWEEANLDELGTIRDQLDETIKLGNELVKAGDLFIKYFLTYRDE